MSKLLKVMMEFEDKIQTLKGKQAQEWLKACDSQITMGWVHGHLFPSFKWRIEKK